LHTVQSSVQAEKTMAFLTYFKRFSILLLLQLPFLTYSFKIAFVGDTGIADPDYDGFGHLTMNMIQREDVNLVVNVGDFEYWGRCWEKYKTKRSLSVLTRDGKSYDLEKGVEIFRYQWLYGYREPKSGWEIGFPATGNVTEKIIRTVVSNTRWEKINTKLKKKSKQDCGEGGPYDGPWEWRHFVRSYNVDFLASSGNHEALYFDGGGKDIWADHQKYMHELYRERILDTGRGICRGYKNKTSGTVKEYGERYSCLYGDHHIILLGWFQGSDDRETPEAIQNRKRSVDFIDREFSREDPGAQNVRWRYCVHHRTAARLSSGGGPDYKNMLLSGITDACRRHGALIISGHHHIYTRTKMLNSVGGSDDDYPIASVKQKVLKQNHTMSIGTGNGGYKGSCDGRYDGRSWMQTCIGGKSERGAVIATFNDDRPWEASFMYKNSITGEVKDRFKLVSKLPGWDKGNNHTRLLHEKQSISKTNQIIKYEENTMTEDFPYYNRRPFNAELQRGK